LLPTHSNSGTWYICSSNLKLKSPGTPKTDLVTLDNLLNSNVPIGILLVLEEQDDIWELLKNKKQVKITFFLVSFQLSIFQIASNHIKTNYWQYIRH